MTTEVNNNCIVQAHILNLQSEIHELKEIVKCRDASISEMHKTVKNMYKYFKWMFIAEVIFTVLSKL